MVLGQCYWWLDFQSSKPVPSRPKPHMMRVSIGSTIKKNNTFHRLQYQPIMIYQMQLKTPGMSYISFKRKCGIKQTIGHI